MRQEHGDINVCVYNYCHEMPCESIVPEYRDNDFYINFCEFLTEDKMTQYNENSRGKMVAMLSREHRCLRTGKIISVYNNCDECEYYVNYPEVIEQQAEKIAELEDYIKEIKNE